MDKSTIQPEARGGLTIAAVTIAGFFLSLILLCFVWMDKGRAPNVRSFRAAEERFELLNEQKAKDAAELGSYGWIDRGKGVVRLPVERAMELLLEEMNGTEN